MAKLSLFKSVGIMSAIVSFGFASSLYSMDKQNGFEASILNLPMVEEIQAHDQEITEVQFYLKSQGQIEIERSGAQKVKVNKQSPKIKRNSNTSYIELYLDETVQADLDLIKSHLDSN